MPYRPRELEREWQDRWADSGRYHADPEAGDADATFVTVPYPYPSGGMHVGHARTYTVPDAYARYRRLQGDNVLFPIAWHVTGTPIVGAVNRLREREDDQVSTLRDTYGVPPADFDDLETPMGYARYFVENHYRPNMAALGLSVDWRREFTTNDQRYAKFVAWQYETLRDHGRLERGRHPVKYCTSEENPVTTHDLLEGEDAEFQEYTLVKFERGDTVVPMATLRPETVRGVTNAYVDPEAAYVEASVDGERWLVSEAAVRKLALQQRDVEVRRRVRGAALVGERVTNPVTGEDVLVLPASFVDADDATGVVMSVPAHSPDDWVALQEVKRAARRAADGASGDDEEPRPAADDRLREYGVDPDEVAAIEPEAVIDVEGYDDALPARAVVEEYGVESGDDPALEDATQELYTREFHRGRLGDAYGEYAGDVVEDVRDALVDHYTEQGAFDAMYEFSEDVVCRCGGDVEVAEQDTWFLTYGDGDWKRLAHEAVADLDAIPEHTRDQLDHTVDWLDAWPCIRNYGLGTRLPWDDDFVVEPLSDSTVYTAYYTVAHRLRDVPPEALDREFFDALFYGPDAVDDPDERALELRAEYDYWYPVDYRVSGNDLVSNHLTFYLFHHADLFDESRWPAGVAVMGMGLLEGEAMSSSSGHVVLPSDAIEEYGADTVRFFLLHAAQPWQDFDWRGDDVAAARDRLARFYERAEGVVEAAAGVGGREDVELRRIDEWLLSKLQRTVRDVADALDGFETRTATQAAFYRFDEHLSWYRRRTDRDRDGARWTLREVLRTRLRLLAPVVPFLANDLHERLTGRPVDRGDWPEPDAGLESDRVEAEEDLVRALVADVREVLDVTDTDPDRIAVYTAAPWKQTVYETVREVGPDVGAVMNAAVQRDGLRERGDAVSDLAEDLVADVRERDGDELAALDGVDERDVYERAAGFLAREFDAAVDVVPEQDADSERASRAVPLRPAIEVA